MAPFAAAAAPVLASASGGRTTGMAKKKAEGESKKRNGDGPSERPPEAPGRRAGRAQPQLTVLAQYIKDLSFESPSAPAIAARAGQNPQLKVGVNVERRRARRRRLRGVAQSRGPRQGRPGVIYNVELIYGGLFRLSGIPENMLQPVLFVDCPTILFPFLRRVLADVIRDGGFPPLMLDPIDFARLYAQNLAQSKAGQQAKN